MKKYTYLSTAPGNLQIKCPDPSKLSGNAEFCGFHSIIDTPHFSSGNKLPSMVSTAQRYSGSHGAYSAVLGW